MARSKYGNKKVIVDGYKFDSKVEARRYQELRWMECSGAIHDLELQPKYDFPIKYASNRKVTYTADFKYTLGSDTIVEDVKGVGTAAGKLKWALMKYFHGIEVQIVK